MEQMPFLEHVEGLLKALRRSLLWILAGSILGYVIAPDFLKYLWEPTQKLLDPDSHLIYTRPFEKIGVHIKSSFLLGLLFSAPFVLRELYAFVKPALNEKEQMKLRTLYLPVLMAALVGLGLGYFLALPLIMKAVLRFGGDSAEWDALFSMSAYLNTSLGVLLMSILLMEIPILMYLLSREGWVKASVWRKGRRLSVVINAIVSAFLSPPDPLSMILMMIPLQILYEAGLQLARMAESKKRLGKDLRSV